MKKVLILTLIFFSAFYFFEKDRLPGLKRTGKKITYKIQALLPLVSERDIQIKLDVPFHRQEHSLSCEITALKMVLNYYGVEVKEQDLLNSLPFAVKEPRSKENIWGDPNIGFVGNIDGKMPNTGYGVYEKPIAELASKYRKAEILNEATLDKVLAHALNGRPVIIWGVVGSGRDISWKTKEGKDIKAVFGEHTKVIVGFSGTVSDPRSIYLMDPIYGRVKVSKDKFLKDWAVLDNKAVVVY